MSTVLATMAQRMIVRPLPYFSMLPSNEVFYIHQDREGFIWIGTTNGAARYDGFKQQIFRSDFRNHDLLTSNTMSCITDNQQFVWLGTRAGLNLFDKQTYRIRPFKKAGLEKKDIYSMAAEKDGTVWICTDKRVYKACADASRLEEYRLFGNDSAQCSVTSAYVDRKGSMWILTSHAGLFRYDRTTNRFKQYPKMGRENSPYVMFEDREGNYWIGTWGEGLWQFYPGRKSGEMFKRHNVVNSRTGKSDPVFFSIAQDDAYGYLWLLSYNELYAMKPDGHGGLEPIDINRQINTDMMYTQIMKDREGCLWIGAYDMAYTISFDRSGIDNYPLARIKTVTGHDTNLLCLCTDSDGSMWVGQDRYGLCLYDMRHDVFLGGGSAVRSLLGEVVQIKQSARGGVWVRSRYGNRIARVARERQTMHIKDIIDLKKQAGDTEWITDMEEDRAGNLFITTPSRLYVKPQGSRKLLHFNNKKYVMTVLARDLQGELWSVSKDRTVVSIELSDRNVLVKTAGRVPGLAPQEYVSHVCIDGDGCLWLTTSLERIIKSDSDKRRFKETDIERQTGTSSVKGCVADKNNVWLITNKNVLKYDIYRNTFKNYDTTDENIKVDVFRYNAYGTDNQGGLYAGGYPGFIHIKSDIIPAAVNRDVRPVISDVKVRNVSLFFAPDDTTGVNTVKSVRLEPGARDVEISFSTLLYSTGAKARVAYKLEGVDDSWVYPERGKNTAFYNETPSGTHRFMVKVEYDEGKWTAGTTLLTVTQAPPFYKTWLAFTLYIICVAAGCLLLSRAYTRRMKLKNNARIKEELARLRLNYFSSVSHELLTPLTVISCIVENITGEDSKLKKQAAVLRSNTDKLKRLIQQALNFRSIGVGKMGQEKTSYDTGKSLHQTCETQPDEPANMPQDDQEQTEPADGKPVVLLIDNNTELLYAMRSMLETDFSVLTATEGHRALTMLAQNDVDTVVCDVVLPDMSGWKLCSRIKHDLRFNDISVIILTAMNDTADRVRSYNAGADAYMTKPFETAVLKARILNLINAKKARQDLFRKDESLNLETVTGSAAERKFMQTIAEGIERHISESDFDLETLASEMGMSRSTLYRKIKSVTGMTPLDFVNDIKMKHACMLLMQQKLTISEVAYTVGFSNPKYFTKCFKEEFGVTPTEYQQKSTTKEG